MFRTDFWRKLGATAAGFTLLETVVAMGLLSMAVGMTVPGVFQVLRFEQFWQDRVTATRDLRHAGSRFSGDVLGARTTNLVDGEPAATVTLTTNTNHEITYGLNPQDELVRSYDDGVAAPYESTLAARVESVAFSVSGDVLTMTLEVYSVGTETKTMILRSTLR